MDRLKAYNGEFDSIYDLYAIAEKLKNIKLQSFTMPRYIDEEFLEETKENVE